jgi:hypothetical protein
VCVVISKKDFTAPQFCRSNKVFFQLITALKNEKGFCSPLEDEAFFVL